MATSRYGGIRRLFKRWAHGKCYGLRWSNEIVFVLIDGELWTSPPPFFLFWSTFSFCFEITVLKVWMYIVTRERCPCLEYDGFRVVCLDSLQNWVFFPSSFSLSNQGMAGIRQHFPRFFFFALPSFIAQILCFILLDLHGTKYCFFFLNKKKTPSNDCTFFISTGDYHKDY